MTLSREDVKQIAEQTVQGCKTEIDSEIQRLHAADAANAWTEDKAKKIAESAADLAVKRITDNFYMSVGKKTIATVGAIVVGLVFFLREEWARWTGFK
jgi:hypothetical protein